MAFILRHVPLSPRRLFSSYLRKLICRYLGSPASESTFYSNLGSRSVRFRVARRASLCLPCQASLSNLMPRFTPPLLPMDGFALQDNVLVCATCGIVCKTTSAARRHEVRHVHTGTLYECRACSTFFTAHRSNLAKHMRTSHPSLVMQVVCGCGLLCAHRK